MRNLNTFWLIKLGKGSKKINSKIWDIYQIRADPPHPWGNCDIKNCDKIQKPLPPPPLKEIVTFVYQMFEGTDTRICTIWRKWKPNVTQLDYNRANTNKYNEKALKIGWKVGKSNRQNFDMQSFPPCHNFK